uniref:Uncharacterized protein n=1 Tax=Bionectria ochroleuca TaxID=29856 RepID=A0A8H7NMI8_BIOOC
MSEILHHPEPLPSAALKPCANMFPSVAQRCLPVRILPIAYAPKWTASTAAGFSETFKFQSSVKTRLGMENSVYLSVAGKERATTAETHRLIDGSCAELANGTPQEKLQSNKRLARKTEALPNIPVLS